VHRNPVSVGTDGKITVSMPTVGAFGRFPPIVRGPRAAATDTASSRETHHAAPLMPDSGFRDQRTGKSHG
jgi:hypothetical protein